MADEIQVDQSTTIDQNTPSVPAEPIPLEPTGLQADPASNGTGKTTTIDQNTPEQTTEVKTKEATTTDQDTPKETTEIVPEEKPVQVIEEKKPEVVELPKKDEETFSPRKYLMSLLVKANLAVQNKKIKNLEKLMEYFTTHAKVTNNDVEKLLGVKDSMATKYLNTLLKEGKIERHGVKKSTWYSKT